MVGSTEIAMVETIKFAEAARLGLVKRPEFGDGKSSLSHGTSTKVTSFKATSLPAAWTYLRAGGRGSVDR
jgi:hypothetical protein